jgi:hypothetical protein
MAIKHMFWPPDGINMKTLLQTDVDKDFVAEREEPDSPDEGEDEDENENEDEDEGRPGRLGNKHNRRQFMLRKILDDLPESLKPCIKDEWFVDLVRSPSSHTVVSIQC